MKKILFYLVLFIVLGTHVFSQNVNSTLSSALVHAKVQQIIADNNELQLNRISSLTSLPEQDLAGAIPVCQTSYSVANSYVGYGLISEVAANTCLVSNEKNSVWYSITAYTGGRLKYTITPNNLLDDYDYALYDLTGHSYADIQSGIITPIICNFSAAGGKTGLDSIGTNYSEGAGGSLYNPLLNLIQGHVYMLNISNFSSSSYGYSLSFNGTTAIIGGMNSTVQSVVSYCGTDSLTMNLSAPVLNSSIASNGSDFLLANTTGTYNVISAYGTSSNGFSNSIVLKLDNLLSSSGTYSLGLVNGSDGNTLLNVCSSVPLGVSTFTFNNSFISPPPTTICQNQSFTLSALPATSYTWTGSLVPPLQINNQNLSIATNSVGAFTFTLEAFGNCGLNTQTFSININTGPNAIITCTAPLSCANSPINLHASGANYYSWVVMNQSYDGNGLSYQINNTTSDFLARPLQQNVYKVIGTNTVGCSSATFYTLSILPSPVLVISGLDSICFGSNTILTYSGTASTYTWSTGAVNIPTVSISPTNNTNYALYGTNGSNGCAATVTKNVKVIGKLIITPTVGSSICLGDSTRLTVTGASAYTWDNGATTSSIVVTPTVSTTYTVNGNTSSCGLASNSYPITVNPLPNIPITQITSPICGGSTTSFSVPYSGTTSYTWSSGSTAYMTTFIPSVSLTSYTNSISLIARTSLSCKNTNTLSYTVYPTPTISTSLSSGICVADTSLLVASGASTYTWNPGSIVSNSIIVSPTVSTTYSVLATSIDGCKNTQTVTIGIAASSSLTAMANPSITCSGKTTTLTVSGNGAMRWYKSDTTSQYVSTSLSYITPTLSVGTYTYYVSSTCSNYSVKTPVTFTVSANPTIGVSAISNTVCENTSFQVTASGANTYTWSSGSPYYINQVSATMTTSIPNGYSTVLYTVNAKDINGCAGTNTIAIKLYPTQNSLTITTTPTIACIGTPMTLSLTGATSYTWSNGVSSSSTVITPTNSMSSSVTIVNTYGCLQTNYVYMNVYARPTISVTYSGSVSNTTLCAGSTQTLFASGAATYTWNSGATTSSISVSPTVTTNYTVTGEAAGLPGCSTTAVKTITVYAQPNVQITANKDTICMGSALSMTVNGASSLTWNDGSAYYIYSVPSFTTPTSYTVIGTGAFGCKKTVTKNIEVYTISQVTAVATPSAVCYGETTTISAIGVLNYTVVGYGAPYNTPKVVYPQWTPPNTYAIDGKDNHGCVSSSYVNVPTNYSAAFYTNVYNSAYSNTVCAGTNVTITTSTPSLTYAWLPGNLTTNSIIVTPSVSTVYTVTGTNGICIFTNTIAITTKPSPTVSVVSNGTITCATQATLTATASPSVTFAWYYMSGTPLGVTTYTTLAYSGIQGYKCLATSTTNSCVGTATVTAPADILGPTFTYTAPPSICVGETAQIVASGAASYNFNYSGTTANSIFTVSPTTTTTYTLRGIGTNSCVTVLNPTIVVTPNPTISIVGNSTVCAGTSASITATGADTYSWSTGANTANIVVVPAVAEIFTVTGTELINNCSTTQTVIANVDITCADVWPGDANSDGIADNLDVLELGLHYTQTGAPRASTNNNWQSYFANNWVGTISNSRNLNHSDCNGDGVIDDNDTLAIFNNYASTHAFKPTQTNTINPPITIVPDQAAVVKGTWGTASVYLGDATFNINNINGVAFTVDFDNTLIEPNSIWIEYQNSFIDASQNLYFRKLDFINSKLFTASTHTVSNNVNGFGKIATLHYQILSSLATDQVLNIGLSQANHSNASGVIFPLTTGTGTLMAIGASVGLKESLMTGNVLISPNPTNGLLNISFNTSPQNTKIELYNSIGALVLTEAMTNKNNAINVSDLSSGIYFMKVLEGNKVVAVKKVVRE
jgi:hypothetical protein